MNNKLYRFRFPKQLGKYQVMFYHIPGKWISTGTDDIREAVLWAEKYLQDDLRGQRRTDVTLLQFARNFFTPEDPYKIRMRDQKYGHNYKEYYYEQRQGFLNNYILKRFGSYKISAITDVAIENWFLDLKSYKTGEELSDDSKNKVLNCLRIVLKEAHRQGLVSDNQASQVTQINAKNEPRMPFTREELNLLFPSDDAAVLKVWGSLMWATYFLIMKDTGFRPGEVAAIQKSNYYPQLHGLFCKESVYCRTREIQHSIKTSKKGQDYKVGILTSQTERFLQLLINETKGDYLFMIGDRFINPFTSNKHFRLRVDKVVERNGRTQYSLRHSFETDLAGRIEDKRLIELMAHTSFNPVYDHRTPEVMLSELQPIRDLLEER